MYTLKSIVKHNAAFVDAFVDLKVEGWKSFEKALNAYTYSFYKDQVAKATEAVNMTAKNLKTITQGVADHV